MRREGIVFLSVLIVVTILVSSIDTIINTFMVFLLAGVIPGTQLAFSSGSMFMMTVSLLVAMLLWPFRLTIRSRVEKYTMHTNKLHHEYAKRRRFRHTIH